MKAHLHGAGAGLLVSFLLVACGATGPKFSAAQLRPVGSNQIQLVVYRPQTLVGSASLDVPFVYLDDRRLTRMRIGGHLILTTTAGRHTLRTTESLFSQDTGTTRGVTEFEAEGGSTVYVRYTESFAAAPAVSPGGFTYVRSAGTYRFEPVPKEVALRELEETHRLDIED